MTLSDEVLATEATLRDAGVSLDEVLATADVDRSTWTRWKNGSVKGARYDTMAKIKAAVAAKIEGKTAEPTPDQPQAAA